MALWRLYYHLVWTTKERQPLIVSEREPDLYSYIIGKSNAMRCIVHAIGGMEEHIHLIVSIPPTLAIAEFVKKIKGSSAYQFNQESPPNTAKFGWQRGYGVFSLGGKQLENAIAYVQNQKQHHTQGTIVASLERADAEDNPPPEVQLQESS
ncbi:IS200/IS605 family transposase [Lusitaniella coriacea]|uniref:IS200/IS605 family transposase n=1 Tax=Lusitaniella coriacea TaxID=1983105 RepID=UPI003CF35F97